MTVDELFTRFPVIPTDLYKEPLIAEFARVFDEFLRVAHKPSACSSEYDAGNHFYLKLVGPLEFYRYGLTPKEKILSQVKEFIEQYQRDPDNFIKNLLPPDVSEREIKGPGCGS
ncbi:MAG: hypothetical protein D6813_01080 [Calditrichaeota bacterium]|nr:MAG: hypothetical protein D6813_01080 [Calditrichota bacterium]